MSTILDKLAQIACRRVENAKKNISADEIKERALSVEKGNFGFEKALAKSDISFICECKKASPSKGIIAEYFPYLEIAREYESAGADCISVLTEPEYFLGNDKYLDEIAHTVNIPCLRKDFTVDEYMIYEAKLLGASAVLLICSILDDDRLKKYIGICDDLGLSALVEAHDGDEIKSAVNAGARIIGVNNRNLKDFSVNTSNAASLRKLVPDNILFVAESGIKSPDDIRMLEAAGADAVLIGETLMRAENKKQMLDRLKGKIITI